MDLNNLLDIRDQVGPEALTQEEQSFLQEQTAPPPPEDDHYANLAEAMEPQDLRRIAQEVVQWVEWDDDSRADWREAEARGIRALGVTPNKDGGAGFTGASRAVHPTLAEASVQFASRALENIWPAGGPVKSAVIGNVSEERLAQAARAAQFMNYQYTELMPGAFDQFDQMLHRLPVSGSCFVKTYPDYQGKVTRRLVEPVDFIVPYKATDLETTPRYTERVLIGRNNLRKMQVSGYYRDIKLQTPNEQNNDDRDTVIDEIEAAEGRSETSNFRDDHRHTLYECTCEYNLPGFEDPDGIAKQYLITVDSDSEEVLGIFRNWEEGDEEEKRTIYHTHYKFTPGLGFYGYGLYHWIGSLSGAATGALRALLDSGHLANLQGGYRSRDARMEGGDKTFTPGEYKEVDASGEDLSKAFYNLPFKEPSSVLFQLLGHIETLSRRFAGTTDVMIGEGNTNVPVGTTLARIEQGTKMTSAIQKRLHVAAGREFRIVAWLDSIFLPQEYPYAVENEDRTVMRDDFDDRVDILPVSDPNFVSNTQRQFTSEVSLDIAQRNPELYDLRELHRRAQASLRIEDLDGILPPPDENIQRMGPVEENAALLMGRPVKAYPEQNHEAHLQVLTLFEQGLDNDQMQKIGPTVSAHKQEHMAMAYLMGMQQLVGMAFQMPKDKGAWQDLPIEQENQIAVMAAMAMQQAMQAQPQTPDPATMDQMRKQQMTEADIHRKDTVATADIIRDNAKAEAGIQVKTAEAGADMNRKATEAMFNAKRADEAAKNAKPIEK